MNRSSKQTKKSVNKYQLELYLRSMNLIDIYRLFHPPATEYTFLSSAHETLYKVNHISDHKTSLSNGKNEIMPTIFTNHMVCN